jgi:hypothetical protein
MSKMLISMMLRLGIDVFWERSVLICRDSSAVARLRCGEGTLWAIRPLPSRELTEVQPIKIVIALARVSCARTSFNVVLPKGVNKTGQTRDSIPDQVKSLASLRGPLLALLLSLWAVPPYLMGRRPHLSEGRKQGSSCLRDHVCGAEKQPGTEKTPQWSGLYRNKKCLFLTWVLPMFCPKHPIGWLAGDTLSEVKSVALAV